MKIKNQKQKQNQKGISSSLGILIIVIVSIVAVGGALAYQYMWSPDEPIEEIIKPSMSEEEIAEKVVVDAFTYLHNREYDKAVPLFAWDQLSSHDNLAYEYGKEKNKEKALEISCGGGGYNCSEFTVVGREKLEDGHYRFMLQFITAEGEIRTSSCCGMEVPDYTEEEWEKYGFDYSVKKIKGEYKVMRGPQFTP